MQLCALTSRIFKKPCHKKIRPIFEKQHIDDLCVDKQCRIPGVSHVTWRTLVFPECAEMPVIPPDSVRA